MIIEPKLPMTAERAQSLETLRIQSERDLSKSFGAAFREAVPFARPLMQPETFSMDFSEEKIDFKDKEINKLMSSIPDRYYPDLLESKNKATLIANIHGIQNSLRDTQFMQEQHGLGASLALYAGASLLDPMSYFAYGIAARVSNGMKFAERLSTMEKAGYWGASGAAIEGSSEAVIQSFGQEDYGMVPISAGAGLVFAGGSSLAHSLLTNRGIANQEKAYKELSEPLPDLHTPEGQQKVAELVDIINTHSGALPVKNAVHKAVDFLTLGKVDMFRSPTFRAWNMGGKASAMARLVDTPVGLSKDADGNFIPHAEKTVYDEKYTIAKDMLQLEVDRIKAFKESGLPEEEFVSTVFQANQKLRQEYLSNVMTRTDILKEDEAFIQPIKTEAERVIKEKDEKGEIDYSSVKDTKKDNSTGKVTKLTEEELKHAKEVYRQKLVDKEVDRVARREAVKQTPDLEVNTGNKSIDDMVHASSKYYESMHNRMIDSGIEGTDDMLPKYYTPIVYDIKAIRHAEEQDVIDAFEQAIKDSPIYKQEVAKAFDNMKKSESFDNDVERMKIKEIEDEIRILKELQAHDEFDYGSFLAKLNQGYARRTNDMTITQYDIDEFADTTILDTMFKDKMLKELSRLSGLTKDDISILNTTEKLGNDAGLYFPSSGRIGLHLNSFGDLSVKSNLANLKFILRHEMIHAMTSRMLLNNPAMRKDIDKLMTHLASDSVGREFYENVKRHAKSEFKDVHDLEKDIRQSLEYMFRKDANGEYKPHEFLAEGLANRYVSKALNDMMYKDGVTTKTMMQKFIDVFKKYIGVDIKKGSSLEYMIDTIEKYAQPSVTKKKIDDLAIEAKAIEKEMRMDTGELTDASLARGRELEARLDVINKQIIKSLKRQEATLKTRLVKQEAEYKKTTSGMNKATTDYYNMLAYPKKAAKGTVKKMNSMKKLTDMNFDEMIPSRLKGRTLPVDINHPALDKYVVKNEAALSQMYHYTMSGKIATKGVLGYDNPKEFRRYLEDTLKMNRKEIEVSMDMFELSLGSKQLPDNADDAFEKTVRMMSQFNYITMGGQFGRTALSEIGVGVYRTGFGYINELFPALKTVVDIYRNKNLTQVQQDMIFLGDANAIYQSKMFSAAADTSYIESTLAQGAEKGLKKASTLMFKISGLEAITTMTQLAIPRMVLSRIIKEADRPTVQLDMYRWGVDFDTMDAIKKQPVKFDDNGNIVDFNLAAWDKDVSDKFQRVVMRISRDTVMRPDAVRVPTWMNDGALNPVVKLTRQFMTFAFLAHERLLLNGLQERQAMALVGSVISMGILYGFALSAEKMGLALGIIDEEDAKYNSEEGLLKLAGNVAGMNSFSGHVGTIAETINAMNSYQGGDRLLTRVVGGPTGGRIMQGIRGIEDMVSGKYGTYNQINTLKMSIPFNNLIGIDNFSKDVAGDIVQDMKKKGYSYE